MVFLRFLSKGINIILKLFLISLEIKFSRRELEIFVIYFKVRERIFFNFNGLFVV